MEQMDKRNVPDPKQLYPHTWKLCPKLAHKLNLEDLKKKRIKWIAFILFLKHFFTILIYF